MNSVTSFFLLLPLGVAKANHLLLSNLILYILFVHIKHPTMTAEISFFVFLLVLQPQHPLHNHCLNPKTVLLMNSFLIRSIHLDVEIQREPRHLHFCYCQQLLYLNQQHGWSHQCFLLPFILPDTLLSPRYHTLSIILYC